MWMIPVTTTAEGSLSPPTEPSCAAPVLRTISGTSDARMVVLRSHTETRKARFGARLILVIEDDPMVAIALESALRGADADVVLTDCARGAVLVERPFLSAAVLDCGRASHDRRATVRRLRERRLPFVIYGTEPPDTITSGDGAPFILKSMPSEEVVRPLAFLIGRGGRG